MRWHFRYLKKEFGGIDDEPAYDSIDDCSCV
jgi:hypothetical protein